MYVHLFWQLMLTRNEFWYETGAIEKLISLAFLAYTELRLKMDKDWASNNLAWTPTLVFSTSMPLFKYFTYPDCYLMILFIEIMDHNHKIKYLEMSSGLQQTRDKEG